MDQIIKKPSAWMPIVLSLIVLAIMLVSFALFGVPKRQPDEGMAAHLFQIWLTSEVIFIGFFAFKWLSQRPKESLLVLAIQIIVVLVACAPVFFLGL